MSFTIRRAEVQDVERLAPLFDAYRQFYSAPSNVDGASAFLAARLEREESIVLLALSSTGAVIAFTQLYPSFSSTMLGAVVVLNDLFVAPDWRRHGVAARLIEEVVTYARRTGAVRVELSTHHTNVRARQIYIARGFVVDTEFAYLSLPIEHAFRVETDSAQYQYEDRTSPD